MTESTTDLAKVAEVLDAGGDHMEKIMFPNGHGVSIIRNAMSYGHMQGLFEIAVLDADGNLDYSTPVTDDVIGYLTIPEVVLTMQAVATLPAADSKEYKLLKLQEKRQELAVKIAEKEADLQSLQRDYGDLNREVSELESGL